MILWKILSCLTLVTGFSVTLEACKTNTVECDHMREVAQQQRDADKKCQGMVSYLDCFTADVADCAEGSKSTAYSQNLVNMYCNKATICSTKLNRCYENFTNPIITTIAESDAPTRLAICGPLAVAIMTCTDSVTAECSDQPGLLETVSARQASFNATCGQSVPCVYEILQCQAPILALSAPKTTTTTSDGQDSQVTVSPATLCGDMSSDYCSAYKQAVDCMKQKSQDCGSSDMQISNIVTSLEQSAKTVCSDNMTCPTKMSECMCQLQINPGDPYTGVCANWPGVQNCITKISASCYELPSIQETLTSLNQQYGSIFVSLCQSPGICLPAAQCMVSYGLTGIDPRTTGSTPKTEGFDMSALCQRVRPVFQCLSSSSSTCNIDQSKVTFSQIETKFIEFCQATVPQVPALASCSAYTTCSLSFEGFPNMRAMAGGDDTGTDLAAALEATKAMMRSLTNTAFWCKYIEHGARCVVANSAACNLPTQFTSNVIAMHQSVMQMCGIADQGTTPSTTQSTTQSNKNQGGAKAGESSGGGGTGGADMLQTSSLLLITAAFAFYFFAC